jgi:hypothetical protein
VSEVLVEHV